jgi:hypothetical protein
MQVQIKNNENKVVFFAVAKTSRGLNQDQKKALREVRAILAVNPGWRG